MFTNRSQLSKWLWVLGAAYKYPTGFMFSLCLSLFVVSWRDLGFLWDFCKVIYICFEKSTLSVSANWKKSKLTSSSTRLVLLTVSYILLGMDCYIVYNHVVFFSNSISLYSSIVYKKWVPSSTQMPGVFWGGKGRLFSEWLVFTESFFCKDKAVLVICYYYQYCLAELVLLRQE